MAMEDAMQEAVSYVVGLFNDPSSFAESPLDDVAANLGSENYEEVDPYQVLEQAMDQLGYDDATQEAVMEAAHSSATAEATATATATAEGGYSIDQLAGIFAEGIKVNIDNSEVINEIDNSLYVDGDVHGGVHQSNYTEVTNADDGAIVTDGDNYGDQQTGDGVQVGEAYGDVVQGDGNATGHGIIGDGNTQVGEAYDSNFAQGDVHEDNSYTDNSDNSFNDSGDHSFTDNTADSFNTNDSYNYDADQHSEYSDDDNVHVGVEVETGYGEHEVHQEHSYEEPIEEHSYEPVAEVYEEHDSYDDHDHHHVGDEALD